MTYWLFAGVGDCSGGLLGKIHESLNKTSRFHKKDCQSESAFLYL